MNHPSAVPAPEPLERLRLLIGYDGRPFRGWQSQATRDTVQDHLEAVFAGLVGCPVAVHGAGRTDSGVHALGQVAHADVPAGRLSLHRWQSALNAHLPPEIRILQLRKAAPSFHARFDAAGKVYAYRIWNESYFHPLEIGRAWHLPGELDLQALRRVVPFIEGTHDFAGFAANRGRPPERGAIRTLHRLRVSRRGPLITLRFHGDGFLYKMVRLLTGSLVRCAQHRAEAEWIQRLLAGGGKLKTHFAAPAEGLYLIKVLY